MAKARTRDDEVAGAFPRAWIEFADPDAPDRLFRCDLTWLTSRWSCIYGNGCKGIVAGQADDGCCAHGAFFTDADDVARVRAAAARLPAEMWQLHRKGQKSVTEKEDGKRRTRTVDGRCIFHNRSDFDGPHGCALHHLAASEGTDLTVTKPEVCWQVPIRRTFLTETGVDEVDVHVTVIGEFDRRSWGPGGVNLDWWCSSASSAHQGSARVFEHSRAELVALMGERAYELLAQACRQHLAAPVVLAIHPADPRP
jgi:hypothetical protein